MSELSGIKKDAFDTAVAAGIPPDVFLALIESESSWNPRAINAGGDTGLGQISPATAADYGLDRSRLFDPKYNLESSAKILADKYRATGNWTAAVSAYKGIIRNTQYMARYEAIRRNYAGFETYRSEIAGQKYPREILKEKVEQATSFLDTKLSKWAKEWFGISSLTELLLLILGGLILWRLAVRSI